MDKIKITYRKRKFATWTMGAGIANVKSTPRLLASMKSASERKVQWGRGYYRQNIFGGELIWDDRLIRLITKKSNKDSKYLFIFGHVKRNAVAYGKKNKLKPSNWVASVVWNKKADHKGKKIIGTDVDDAYWKIAFRMGVISEKVYENGINTGKKQLCLAALATLGADKVYNVIKRGVITEDLVIVRGDDNLKLIYQSIRHTCFNYMRQLAKLLGNDFVCYKTDCIYYVNTPKNKKLVTSFFEYKGIDTKILLSMPEKVEEKYK